MRAGEQRPSIYVLSWYSDGSGTPRVRFFGMLDAVKAARYAAEESAAGKAIDIGEIRITDSGD